MVGGMSLKFVTSCQIVLFSIDLQEETKNFSIRGLTAMPVSQIRNGDVSTKFYVIEV